MKVDSLNNTDSFRKEDSSVEDYISLLKPRVMILAIFSSICGLILAPGNIHPFLSFVAIICISMGAGASGAINMWYDKDIDSLMNRTKNRPVPRGAIFSSNALGFGVVLGLLSVLLLGLATNYFAAFLLASSIIFYILINISSLLSDNIYISLKSSLFYFRFIFFAFVIAILVQKIKEDINLLSWFVNIFYFILSCKLIKS